MQIKLFNTLSAKNEIFEPADSDAIKMYVCGPTVYNPPHIGNARSIVFYDLLFRLLRYQYGEKSVKYVRNITDVDDKIIAESQKRGIDTAQLTKEVTAQFHADCEYLLCLKPTHEPRATEHISEMVAMINSLISQGFAYVSDSGNVLFDVKKYSNYGALSNRDTNEMLSGARIEVESYKKNEHDFVLWKPVEADKISTEPHYKCDFLKSPSNASTLKNEEYVGIVGRPGWHIECSAMAKKHLGDTFDIHGGGADLKFPHHENEIAQSVCANGASFAKYWVHNGFLTIDGKKMSKSEGNFITIQDMKNEGVDGRVLRLALLSTHYQKPINFNKKLLEDCSLMMKKINSCAEAIDAANLSDAIDAVFDSGAKPSQENEFLNDIMSSLANNFNMSEYFAKLLKLAKLAKQGLATNIESEEDTIKKCAAFKKALAVLGF